MNFLFTNAVWLPLWEVYRLNADVDRSILWLASVSESSVCLRQYKPTSHSRSLFNRCREYGFWIDDTQITASLPPEWLLAKLLLIWNCCSLKEVVANRFVRQNECLRWNAGPALSKLRKYDNDGRLREYLAGLLQRLGRPHSFVRERWGKAGYSRN